MASAVDSSAASANENALTPDNDTGGAFPSSSRIVGAQWTSHFTVGAAGSESGDILPTTWADDGNLYSVFDDGSISGQTNCPVWRSFCRSGQFKITGDSYPPNLQVTAANSGDFGGDSSVRLCSRSSNATDPAPPAYPCYSIGIESINGVLYSTVVKGWPYGNEALYEQHQDLSRGLWGIKYSTDHGATWQGTLGGSHVFARTTAPSGALETLNWVQYGQDHTGGASANAAPADDSDGHRYIYAVATEREYNASYLFLGRTQAPGFAENPQASAASVTDPSSWQWYAGQDHSGNPAWGDGQAGLDAAVSVPGAQGARDGAFWDDHVTYPHLTYDAGIGRYLLTFTDSLHQANVYGGFAGLDHEWSGGAELVILDAPNPWGPFSFVAREKYFGPGNGYSPSFPVKWISGGGRDLWLLWSANFNHPADGPNGQGPCTDEVPADLCGGTYGMNLRQLHLTLSGDPGALPAGWQQQDIGGVRAPGSGSYANGVYTIAGNGGDIYDYNSHDSNPFDELHYAETRLTGAGQIVARLTGFTGTGTSYASAGVMLRESVDRDARHGYVAVYDNSSPAAGVKHTGWQQRDLISSYTSGPTMTPPIWLKLVRSGDTITGFTSRDGLNWTQTGQHSYAHLAPTLTAGLAVTSYSSDQQLATATFDNVSVSGNTS